MDFRYDVKITAGKVPIDVAPNRETGIAVQDPVFVYWNEDDLEPRKTLQQGDPEYFIRQKAWFGTPTSKARMLVTVYDYEVD